MDRDNIFLNFGFTIGMSEAISVSYGQKYLPNPTVGCALLDKNNNTVIASNHEGISTEHAEIKLLKLIKSKKIDTKDKNLYITLEPCMHEDTSPSCAKEIINSSKFNSITIGDIDPDVRTNGMGFYTLANNNKNVIIEAGATSFINPSYMKLKTLKDTKKYPYMIGKIGVSNDLFMYSEKSNKYITSEESRKLSHYLRGTVDGIMIGKNTLLIDDPELSIRHGIEAVQPQKFVLWGSEINNIDYYLNKYQDFEFLTDFSHSNFRVHKVNTKSASEVLEYLYSRSIYSLMLEGGFETWKFFEKYISRLYLFKTRFNLNNGLLFALSDNFLDNTTISKNISLTEDTLDIYNRNAD